MTHRAVYKSRSVEYLDRFYAEDPAGALQTGGDLLADPNADAFDVASSWAWETTSTPTSCGGSGTAGCVPTVPSAGRTSTG